MYWELTGPITGPKSGPIENTAIATARFWGGNMSAITPPPIATGVAPPNPASRQRKKTDRELAEAWRVICTRTKETEDNDGGSVWCKRTC